MIHERCEQQFDLGGVHPVYTYGENIYNPHDDVIDPLLQAHEATHQIQQGVHPEDWWEKWLTDKYFRFDQELAAYRVEYKTAKQIIKDRNDMAKLLVALGGDLSGPQYGDLCTLQEAIGLIRE